MDARSEKKQELPKANTQPKIKPHELLPKIRRSLSCPKNKIDIPERGLTFFSAYDAVAESKKPIVEPHDGKTKLVEKVEQESSVAPGASI